MEPKFRVDPYLSKEIDFSYFQLSEWEKEYLLNVFEISDNTLLLALSDPHPAMFAVDIFCMMFFIFETLVHFCACPCKKKYFLNPYNILKLVLCVSMVVSLGLDLNKEMVDNQELGNFYLAMRSICVTRLLLIFRLHKLYKGLDIMLLSLKSSLKELCLLSFGFFICVIVYGAMLFSAELETNRFPNIWLAMWWSVITMTTVGYGDYFPTTTFGYFIGIACAINGLLVLALPVAAIASNFATFYTKNGDIQKHQKAIEREQEEWKVKTSTNNSTPITIQEI